MTNKDSESSNYMSPEQHSLHHILMGPRTSREHPERQIDVKRLVNNQAQARVTTINLNSYRPYQPLKKEVTPNKMFESPNFRSEEDEDNESPQVMTSGQLKMMGRISRMSQHQTFITSYQSNHVIGTIIYLLFLVFLTAEVMASAAVAPREADSPNFHVERTLIIVLCSELACYMLMRYLNAKAQNKFLKKTKMLGSLKKLIVPRSSLNSSSSSMGRHYLYLALLVLCLMGGQVIYSAMLSNSVFGDKDGYLVGSIFWANCGVPFLFEHFYISESSQHPKVKMVLMIVGMLIVGGTFLQGVGYLLLVCFKLAYIYSYTRQGFEMFHVDYLIKGLLLVFTAIWTSAKFHFANGAVLPPASTFLQMLLKVIIVTAGMLVARVLALNYLKQELYNHFYTEMHLQVGFVLVTILLYILTILKDGLAVWPVVASMLLLAVGVLIYLQGREKMEVHMDETYEDY